MKLGNIGEEKAAKYLERHGYAILTRNYTCKAGEIDLIARIEETLVFVEVKARKNRKYGNPSESVNKTKQLHIKKAAGTYIAYAMTMHDQSYIREYRIDVIELLCIKGLWYINHIRNAF